MWILKLKNKEKYNIYNKRTIEFNVRINLYPTKHYVKGNKIYLMNSGIIHGEEENKKAFFEDLKKEKKIENLEINGDFFISVYSEKFTEERIDALKAAYNEKFIFLKPAIIDEEGFEEWEVASFERKDLEDLIKEAKKLEKKTDGEFKLLSFKEGKIEDLTIKSILPRITDQQRKALELAVKNKYYGYPKKITLDKLAKMMGISKSTYQFHLSKAEERILTYLTK